RETPLEQSRSAMRYVEHRLELGWDDEALPESVREIMEDYNREDCLSTALLRDWLEAERRKLVEGGTQVPRFIDREEEASDEVEEQQTRVKELASQLTRNIPADVKDRTEEQQSRWLLAQLLDWHRRDAKPKAGRYFELRGMDDADLIEEKDAVAGLVLVGSVTSTDGVTADRYSFPNQETNVRPDDRKEVHYKDRRIGTVVGMNPIARTIDIEKSSEAAGFHPTSIFVKEPYRNVKAQQDSLYRLGCWVRGKSMAAPRPRQSAPEFFFGRAPPPAQF